MGEYAIRKSDNREIKIGTCESMYYLRFFDRDKVRPIPGNIDPMDESILSQLRWRLPYPEEDHIEPGNYDGPAGKDVLLYGFNQNEGEVNPGSFQVYTKYGMLLNIPCYHGEKLLEGEGIHACWNGKGPGYKLKYLKFIDGEPYGVYGCVQCGEEWRRPLKELIPFIGGDNNKLAKRLIEWYIPDPCGGRDCDTCEIGGCDHGQEVI